MAAKKEEAKLPIRNCFAPLPEGKRGYGIHLYATSKGKSELGPRMIYGNGRCVVIRSLADPSKSEIFTGHKGKVNVAVFSPNGEWVASGDNEGTVLVWEAGNKKIKNEVTACRNVLDITWDPEGKRIVAVGDGENMKAKAFAWDSQNNLGDITAHSKAILAVTHRPTKPYSLITASEDLTINTYKGPPYKFEHSFKDHVRYPNSVRFSPDGSQYVSVGADSKIFLFNGENGEKIKEIGTDKKEQHSGSIFDVSWSPDGKSILTCSGDKTVKIWEVESGHCKTTFTINKKPQVEDMQISCLWHEDYLLSVSLSGAINYLDVAHPDAPKKVVQGHGTNLAGFAPDVKNGVFYVSDVDGRIGVWNLKSGECQWLHGKGHEKTVVGLAVSVDGKNLASVGLDDKIRINSVESHNFKEDATDLGGKPVAIASANRDKDLFAVVTAQEKLVLLRGSKVVSTTALGVRPNNVVFSPDDSQVVVSGKDYKVHIFDISHDSAKAGKVLDNHIKEVNVVAFSPSGALVSAGKDRNIFFWVNDKPQNATGWCFHSAQVTDISFSPSGDRVVSGAADENIIVWKDTKTYESTRTTWEAAHCQGVDRVFFWDEHTIISLGADRVIKVWDV